MKITTGSISPVRYCILCRDGINLAGKILYPQYALVNEHLYLGKGQFICAQCLEKLQLIWLAPQPIDFRGISSVIRSMISPTISHSTRKMGEILPDNLNQGWDLPIDRIIYTAPYENYLKELLIQFKYQGRRELAAPLGKLMVASLLRHSESGDSLSQKLIRLYKPLPYTAVVPVPINRERLVERGYNQSQLLAKEIARALSISLWEPVARVKPTSPMKWQTPEDRAHELAGAFQLHENCRDLLSGQENVDINRILLVDDIYTTGATAMEIARVLQGAGCQYITVLTTAH